MDELQPKFSNIVLTIVIFAFGVAAIKLVAKFLYSSPQEVKPGYSYEMGRVQSYTGQFDLSDREIDRQILSEEEKNLAQKSKDVIAKTADKNKKDDKKNAKKANAKNTTSLSNSKKAVLSTLIIGQKDSKGLSETEEQFARSASNNYFDNGNVTAKEEGALENNNPGKSEIKTAQQWKDLLSTNPSMTNVQAFLQAHRKGEVNDDGFYQVSFDLFLDPNKNREQAGYLLLSIDSSINGFTYISKRYGTISESKRSELWKIMTSYSRFDHFMALNTSVGNSDKNVVSLSLQVLQIAVNDVKTAGSSSAGSTPTLFTQASSLAVFIANLGKAVQKSDENSPLANALMTDIQNLLKK